MAESAAPSGGTAAAPPAGRSRQLAVGIVSLLLATLFWAGNYVVGAAAVEQMDPVSLVLERWAIALFPLLIIAGLVERPDWRAALRSWPWLIVSSLLGLAGYNLLLYAALEHTSAFNASLINAFNPALLSLAAAVFLRQRLTPLGVLGIVAALVGVLTVLTGGDFAALLRTGIGAGELLMVGAIVVWTGYTIIGRVSPPVPPITSTALQAVVTLLVLLPVSLATGGPALPATTDGAWALAYIAIFPSVLSYVLWNRALDAIPPARAAVFLNLITVFTAVITALLGHPQTATQLLGGAIVIAGVALANAGAFARRR